MDKAILIEARKRCDEDTRLPKAGQYYGGSLDQSEEMLREIDEILMERQAPKYKGVLFRDCHMRPIIIDENLDLRTALDNLEAVNSRYALSMRSEGLASVQFYAQAQAESKRMRRLRDVAKANAEAAMFRATGRWPHSFYDLGLR